MSTDKSIKKAVEMCISLLPANLQDLPLAFQISDLERVIHQIDGISWLLVVDGRWQGNISIWVQARMNELQAHLDDLKNHQCRLLNEQVDELLRKADEHYQALDAMQGASPEECSHEAA